MPAPHPRFAFFDLDGTLLPWDTQLLFCNHVLRRHGWRRILLVPFFLILPLAALKILRSRGMKRVFLSYLAGMKRTEIEAVAEDFARQVADHHIWPEMRAQLEARRAEGCVLILNTASPDFYAKPIARALGFHHCVATKVVLPRVATFFPDIDGPNNKRAAKIDAMRARGLLPDGIPFPLPGSWSYTDSIVDLPLLECAEQGVLVHPKPKLATLGHQRGWTTLLPSPAVTSAAWKRAAIKMILGLWKP